MSFLSYRLGEKIIKLEKQQAEEGALSDAALCGKLTSLSLGILGPQLLASKPKSGCLNIGLVLRGGLGDQMISAQWAKIFLERLEQEHINFYAVLCFPNTDIGSMLVKDFPHVDRIENHKYFKTHKFDLLLELDYFIKFWKYDRAAIAKYAPSMLQVFEHAFQNSHQYALFNSFYMHYQLMDQCLVKGLNRYDLMGINGLCKFDRHTKPFFAIDEKKVNETLQKYDLLEQSFITIHSGIGGIPLDGLANGVDPNYARQHATKVLPEQLVEDILTELKQQLPDITLVQIGEPEGIKFKNVDKCLIGQTSLRESLDILYAAEVHIGNDSGLIHMRHTMNKRSVVLWGPTAADFLGYPEDENLQASCHACMWLTNDWNLNCPKGYECARCMREHSAIEVVERVKKLLSSSGV